jgi:hypothetical protein
VLKDGLNNAMQFDNVHVDKVAENILDVETV